MNKFMPAIIKEFIRALGKGYTYNIKKNHYTIFGILWGIPVPIVTVLIGMYFNELSLSLKNIVLLFNTYPMYLFFLIHPAMFGIVFGAMGTVRQEKEDQRLGFERNLIKINEELKNANIKLKEIDKLKDTFLSMVSHELLTPLTTIQGYISFIKSDKENPVSNKQIEMLSIADEESDRLKALIEELMDLSKIEANRFVVTLEPTDIRQVIYKIKEAFKPLLESKRLTLKDKLPDKFPLVMADADRIGQVLTNLLANAVKFTPAGGTITIYVYVDDDKLICCIEDTGIGIPKDKLGMVFDKFYQADSSSQRRFGGCGLGLTIAKGIIELHRGRIWADSQAGKGSRFFFELARYNEPIAAYI